MWVSLVGVYTGYKLLAAATWLAKHSPLASPREGATKQHLHLPAVQVCIGVAMHVITAISFGYQVMIMIQ